MLLPCRLADESELFCVWSVLHLFFVAAAAVVLLSSLYYIYIFTMH